MPAGDVHFDYFNRYIGASRVLAFAFAIAMLPLGIEPSWVATIFIGDLMGYEKLGKYIDPDDDQPDRTASEGRIIRRFKALGIAIVAYKSVYPWGIYMLAFLTGTLNGRLGGHRTFWSHSYVFSTILRMILYFWPVAVIIYLYIEQPFYLWLFAIGLTIGLCKADGLHIFLDKKEKRTQWTSYNQRYQKKK